MASALANFSRRGFEATSLDGLAEGLGVRKQTILYHFGSKEGLLDAVIDQAAADVADRLAPASDVTAAVDTVFRLGTQRPELLGLLREAIRLGPPASVRVASALDPIGRRAAGVVAPGALPQAYAMVLGMATEVEVLGALGHQPDLAWLRRHRRALLDLLAGPRRA